MTRGMETRLEQQLKRGVLEMVVLRLVSEKPAHGYELILRLRRSAGGQLAVREGTLYPILYRLEDDGLITSSWQTPDGAVAAKGRVTPKKTYTITPEGVAVLERQYQVWTAFSAAVELLMAGTQEQTPAGAAPAGFIGGTDGPTALFFTGPAAGFTPNDAPADPSMGKAEKEDAE